MYGLFAHITSEPHHENTMVSHWYTSQPLLVVVGALLLVGIILLAYKTTLDSKSVAPEKVDDTTSSE